MLYLIINYCPSLVSRIKRRYHIIRIIRSTMINKSKLERIIECEMDTSDGYFISDIKPYFPFGQSPSLHLQEKDFSSFYGIYIDDEDHIVPLHAVYSAECLRPLKLSFKTNFAQYLEKHLPSNFKDCLFLFHLYTSRGSTALDPEGRDPVAFLPELRRGNTIIHEVLDSLLEDTRGYVIYPYQFDNVLSVFFELKDIPAIRKSYKQKVCARKDIQRSVGMLNSIKLDETETLLDYIEKRSVLKNYYPPDIKKATLLYKFLIS